jgi:hypothetical protein
MSTLRGIAILAVVGMALVPVAPLGADDGLPSAFKQIIPRGRIASVDAPRFVAAEKARIPPEAWVLGVVVDGQARAYSLNLLNRHEIVNDQIGDKAFAAVW